MSFRILAATLALCCTLAFAHSVSAQSSEVVERVRAHDEAARSYFEGGQYAEALAEMVDAQAALPDARRLFNMARCHEELGHTTEAIDLFTRYAETADVAEARRDEARHRAEELQASMRDVDEAEDDPEPFVADSSTSRRRLAPTAFWALLGTTGAAAVAWIALAAASASVDTRHEEAADAGNEARFDRLGELGPRLTTGADVVLGVGLALAVATLVVGLFTDFSGETQAEASRRPARLGIGPGSATFALDFEAF